jgi:sec-independent protein translocase protein TatC
MTLRGARPLHERVHEMTFWEHVEELRRAVIGSLIALAITTSAAWFVSGRVLDLVIQHTAKSAVFLSPTEAFSARMRVALTLGVLAALPVILFRLWRFVVPGLLERERSLLAPLVALSVVFFLLGTAFGFFILVPAMTRVLLGFGTEHLSPVLSIGSTLGFVLGMSLAAGAMFELPLVVAVLAYAGVVTPAFLLRRWREAILSIAVASAVLTPGDALSTTVMFGLPVVLLYFVSILFAAVVRRRKRITETVHAAGD